MELKGESSPLALYCVRVGLLANPGHELWVVPSLPVGLAPCSLLPIAEAQKNPDTYTIRNMQSTSKMALELSGEKNLISEL